jgi:glycyl-tRNA synthetase
MQALHERIMEIAISRGFLLPSAEIYGSPAGFYDYGPIGTAIKRHIIEQWRKIFIVEPGFLEIETSIILPHQVLVASGHVEHFADPVVQCTKCSQRFRADHLLEQKTSSSFAGLSPSELNAKIVEEKISCPSCKGTLGPVGWSSLMFPTYIGSGIENQAFLRPETAQGIFLDFKRVFAQNGSKLPIAIGQAGRSFRNEISPRQGLIRAREFSQMELEYFFNPSEDKIDGFGKIEGHKVRVLSPQAKSRAEVEEISLKDAIIKGYFPNEILAYMVYLEDRLYSAFQIPRSKYHFRIMPKSELPHYSKANVDLEAETSYGWIETSGIAYRTDFDLSSHARHSKEDLSVFVDKEKKKIIPHVIEPSIGIDRTFWCILESSYRPAGNGKEWEWFAFPPCIAPFIAGIFPLMKKDGLDEIARKLSSDLRLEGLEVYYSHSGSIGKRYARADEIGVPYCLTIDYQTKEDSTITIRYRDDGKQERIEISNAAIKIQKLMQQGITSAP